MGLPCRMKEQSVGYELEGLAAVKSFRPDFWLNLGDIIYADVPITGGIGKKMNRSRDDFWFGPERTSFVQQGQV